MIREEDFFEEANDITTKIISPDFKDKIYEFLLDKSNNERYLVRSYIQDAYISLLFNERYHVSVYDNELYRETKTLVKSVMIDNNNNLIFNTWVDIKSYNTQETHLLIYMLRGTIDYHAMSAMMLS